MLTMADAVILQYEFLNKDFHTSDTVGEIIHPQASLFIEGSQHCNTLHVVTHNRLRIL